MNPYRPSRSGIPADPIRVQGCLFRLRHWLHGQLRRCIDPGGVPTRRPLRFAFSFVARVVPLVTDLLKRADQGTFGGRPL